MLAIKNVIMLAVIKHEIPFDIDNWLTKLCITSTTIGIIIWVNIYNNTHSTVLSASKIKLSERIIHNINIISENLQIKVVWIS